MFVIIIFILEWEDPSWDQRDVCCFWAAVDNHEYISIWNHSLFSKNVDNRCNKSNIYGLVNLKNKGFWNWHLVQRMEHGSNLENEGHTHGFERPWSERNHFVAHFMLGIERGFRWDAITSWITFAIHYEHSVLFSNKPRYLQQGFAE